MNRQEFDILIEETLRQGPSGEQGVPSGATGPHAHVGFVSAVLSKWSAGDPPRDLAERILLKVSESQAAIKGLTPPPGATIPFPVGGGDRKPNPFFPPGKEEAKETPFLTVGESYAAFAVQPDPAPHEPNLHHLPLPWLWRNEWWAAAACIVALVGVLIPAVDHSREQAGRQACQFNLATVSDGLHSYRASSGGHLPFVPTLAGANWAWASQNGEPVAPNTRHLFLLVKQGYIQPQTVICSSGADEVALNCAAERLCGMDNFEGPHQLSYSFHNMNGGQPQVSQPAQFAILADRNPYFDAHHLAEPRPPTTGNSFNHAAAGQNVLYHDGHAEWHGVCNVGVQHDDIWTAAGKVASCNGTEPPAGPDDSFLVP